MDPVAAHRAFFAHYVTALAGVPGDSRLREAFAATPREDFVGPGPWQVFTRAGYIATPTADPSLLYQDFAVALKVEAQINNGQPSLHAACLAALLARLADSAGAVDAYEIDAGLAERARINLAPYPTVTVHARSGAEGPLPACDGIYVNAGATSPLAVWLDALRPGGRLHFPLTGNQAMGAMLLVERQGEDRFAARFVSAAAFIPCLGARDEETGRRLSEALQRGGLSNVRSLRRGSEPDETAWFTGDGWWLSIAEPA
jgi:protein-L-isoaspartate(D-aspartate) O-methyltransferase